GSRQILIAVPPRELLEHEIVAPEDAVLFLLESFCCAAAPDLEPPYERSPFLLNGTTFLSMRRPLALALLQAPGYRQGAAPKMRREMASQAEALLAPIR